MQGKLQDVIRRMDANAVSNELYTFAVVVAILSYAVCNIGFVTGILISTLGWLLFILFENTYLHSAQVLAVRAFCSRLPIRHSKLLPMSLSCSNI